MKINFLALSALLLLGSCGVKKDTIVTYTESYSTEFTPNFLEKNLEDDLKLKIEPINGSDLNREFYLNSNLDGNYSKESSFSYFNFINNSTSSDRKSESIKRLFNKLDELVLNDELSKYQASLFKEKIYTYFILDTSNYGFNGSENFSASNEILTEFNPYYSNKKYLSVFKMTFENASSDIKQISIKDFQVFSKDEVLHPFSNEFFDKQFSSEKDQDKLKQIYRVNMPDVLRLLKNQPTVKYISTPALNIGNQKLVVNFIKGDKSVDYTYNVEVKKKKEEVRLNSYGIKYKLINGYPNFNIYSYEDFNILMNSDKIFINEKFDSETHYIYTLNVDFKRGDLKLSKTKFIPSEQKNNIILIQNKN